MTWIKIKKEAKRLSCFNTTGSSNLNIKLYLNLMLPSHKAFLLSNQQSLTCFGHQEYSCTTRKGKVYFFDLLRKFILESLGCLVFYLVGHKALDGVGQAMEPRFTFAVRRRKSGNSGPL